METLIGNYIQKFGCRNDFEYRNAVREVAQRIVLCGIARSRLFDSAVFYGGTSLRILRDLDRFSEDLDFVMIEDASVDFAECMNFAVKELASFGIDASVQIKEKNVQTGVISSYVKFNLRDTMKKAGIDIAAASNENMSIKAELETSVAEAGNTEFKTVVWPGFAKVRTFDMPTMFSSKLMAVLERNWKSRVKGRDFYDYLFYMSREVVPNYDYLTAALRKKEKIGEDETVDPGMLKIMLKERFEAVDFESAWNDVSAFVSSDRMKYAFNRNLFISTLEHIR
ncbi:MAG: nucleotidyl transferase AbiEii/AbiGii toxin family protein [Firmicutes bacterium]|nr:nucleotidyl transferase AbiEii/AbiGii toxin family protein [Bacillota bacterium]